MLIRLGRQNVLHVRCHRSDSGVRVRHVGLPLVRCVIVSHELDGDRSPSLRRRQALRRCRAPPGWLRCRQPGYTACMIKASVSQTRNGLSGLLAEVRQGETVIIMQRGRPVAKITRYDPAGLTDDLAAAELVRSGLPIRQKRHSTSIDFLPHRGLSPCKLPERQRTHRSRTKGRALRYREYFAQGRYSSQTESRYRVSGHMSCPCGQTMVPSTAFARSKYLLSWSSRNTPKSNKFEQS